MFSEKTHRIIFLFGACSLGLGIMLGAVPTSIPQIILLGNWLLEGRFKEKWQLLKSNKVFWALNAVFFLHIIGLLYSSQVLAGLDDVKVKMPLLFLPLVFFSSRPLQQKEFQAVLLCFLFGSLWNTAWCLLYNFMLHNNEVGRSASRFMSHIRLGLYLNMAIVTCGWFVRKLSNRFYKAGFTLLAIYFLIVMGILGLASGLSAFFILVFVGLCVIIYSQKLAIKLIALILLGGSAALIASYVLEIKKEQLAVKHGESNIVLSKNEAGHGYLSFDTINSQKENGNYVFINIQLEELKRAWQHKFPQDSFSYDPHPHNLQRFTILLRYMASKGLNKDSIGFSKLNAQDLRNIKKDIGNYRYDSWGFLHKRVYELVNEYDEFVNHRSINGHSLTMRVYFWKAALHVIKQHPVFGVGTGDVQQQMNEAYLQTHSPLQPDWYKRPHNQFLTVTVALGIAGLSLLLLGFFYPMIVLRKYLTILFWPFFILAFISCFTEDTLETQAGLTFYVFFNTLFLSVAWFKKKGMWDE